MPDEQLFGRDYLQFAADLFALGCVLFEMVTGQRYKRQDAGTLPSQLRPETPRWLDKAVAKALHKDAAQRWQSASEFAAALKSPPAQSPEETKAREWLFPALELTFAIISLAIALISFLKPGLWPVQMTGALIEFVGFVAAAIAIAIPVRRGLLVTMHARRVRPPVKKSADLPATYGSLFQVLALVTQVLALVTISGFIVIVLFLGCLGYLAFLSSTPPIMPAGAVAAVSPTATTPVAMATLAATPVPAVVPELPTPTPTPIVTPEPLAPNTDCDAHARTAGSYADPDADAHADVVACGDAYIGRATGAANPYADAGGGPASCGRA
jgi:hypothetical protein